MIVAAHMIVCIDLELVSSGSVHRMDYIAVVGCSHFVAFVIGSRYSVGDSHFAVAVADCCSHSDSLSVGSFRRGD